MKVTFLGAAQTVTGSCYIIEANGVRFAVDCGMHQGNKDIEQRNLDTDLYSADKIDFVLITHAHIDHSGLLPRMTREGFSGPIYCTEPTVDLLEIMLLDSAHIQEKEAEWENVKRTRKGLPADVEALYTQDDAKKASSLMQSVQYDRTFEPGPGIRVKYRDAGHILGSAFLELEITESEGSTKLVFSGDLGQPDTLLMNDPDLPSTRPDYLFMESTYGDRNHKNKEISRDELVEAITYAHNNGGKMVIPAFAVERTQEILFTLYLLLQQGKLPKGMPVFLDSPLAIRATEIFRRHPSYLDDELQAMAAGSPMDMPNLRYTLTTEESQAINGYSGPAIIISASGMCNAGRIKHHLRHNLWDPKSCVVFVGYQAVGTPGRKIVDGAKSIKMLGDEIAINARIFTIGGFSSHAGQSQILNWVKNFMHPGMRVLLVHGEEKAQTALAALVRGNLGLEVEIPTYLEEMTLAPGLTPMVQVDSRRAKPKVNWDVLLGDSQSKMERIRSELAAINALPWEDQVELRDAMLEINGKLLDFMARM